MKYKRTAIIVSTMTMAWLLASPSVQAVEVDDTPVTSRALKLSIHFGGRTWQMILSRLAISLLVIHQPPDDDAQVNPDLGEATAEVTSDEELATDDVSADVGDGKAKSQAKVLRSDTPLSEESKLLPNGRPAWVGQDVDVSRKDHYVAVGGIPSETFELSKESLRDGILLNNVRDYLNRYVLEEIGSAELLPQIDTEFIEKRWLVPDREYDANVEMATGSYHMAWCQLKIPERDRNQVIEWVRDLEREERLRQAAGVSVMGFLALGVVHLGVGFIARRKKV